LDWIEGDAYMGNGCKEKESLKEEEEETKVPFCDIPTKRKQLAGWIICNTK
jgi:hypothetical protein